MAGINPQRFETRVWHLHVCNREVVPVCGELLILAEQETKVQTCQGSRDG